MTSRTNMNWVALYAYPAHLAQLQPGEALALVCPPAWNRSLREACKSWVKAHTDWAEHFIAVARTERPDGYTGLYVYRGDPATPRWPYPEPRFTLRHR